MTSSLFFVEPSWVLQLRESRRDSTSRPWSFGDVEFPLEARVTPVGLLIDSAIGLFAESRDSTTRKECAAFR
jgi:hypothetical protein